MGAVQRVYAMKAKMFMYKWGTSSTFLRCFCIWKLNSIYEKVSWISQLRWWSAMIP